MSQAETKEIKHPTQYRIASRLKDPDYVPFALSKKFVHKYSKIKPPFGFNGLGELVYRRTYSRIKADGTNEQWFETVERVVNGTYNMQKRWVLDYALTWDDHKAQDSAQEMYDRMFNMKFLPPGRGLWAMGSPITEERGLFASLNNCFSYETEFITDEGIKKLGDCVNTNQTILSRSGKWVKAEIKSFGKQKLKKLTLSRQGIEKIIYVTDNHRWFAKSKSDINHNKGYKEYLTKDLKPDFRLQYVFGQNVKDIELSPFGIAHGISFGDATTASKCHLYLCGEKKKELLKWFPNNNYTFDKSKDAIRVSSLPNYFKDKPSLKESKSYLYGWLAGYFAADGSLNANCEIVSYNKENILFVRDVCTKLGIMTYSIIQREVTHYDYKDNKKHYVYSIIINREDLTEDFFLLSHHKNNFLSLNNKVRFKKYWNVKSVEDTDRVEEVYCAVVPEYACFALADNILTGNCSYISTENIDKDFSKPFIFLMDMSMLGVGVGFDTKGAEKIIVKGPRKHRQKEVYEIPDTREGWVTSVEILLDSYFKGTPEVEFNYDLIRKEGESIKGFGGISSGPKPLVDLHLKLREILDNQIDEPISITSIVDIMNLIGKCVVSGNVRRTAEIVFGDPHSEEYLDLKNYNVNPNREQYGWTSNNSIFAELGMNYEACAERTRINGEPGYAWLENMQNFSRMNTLPDFKDHRAKGGNPCLEQTLESAELCCLVENFPNRHKDLDDFLRTLKFSYLYAKTVTLAKTHWPETNAVMLRNRRIGCSVSGIAQFLTDKSIGELKVWLEAGYEKIQYYDNVYSEWLAIPKSIKTTSVKPSGSVSLLAGSTPGIHFPLSEYYIRRVRLAKTSELIKPLQKAGYLIEPAFGNEDSTVVVEIPVHVGKHIRSDKNVCMWEKLSLAAFMQRYWADNQVSCTVTFNPDTEGKNIAHALNYFQYQLKGISFLPMKEGVQTYKQMPYEEISEDEYKKKMASLKKVDFSKTHNENEEMEKFCDGETCTLK